MCLITPGQTTLEKMNYHPLFQDSGDMRFAKAKSTLKTSLEVQVSCRMHCSKGVLVIDGSAIHWCLDWPKDGFVSHLTEKMLEYVERRLIYNDV